MPRRKRSRRVKQRGDAIPVPPTITSLPWNRATLLSIVTMGDSASPKDVTVSGLFTVLQSQLGIKDNPTGTPNGFVMRLLSCQLFAPAVINQVVDFAVEVFTPISYDPTGSGKVFAGFSKVYESTTLGPGPASIRHNFNRTERLVQFVQNDTGDFAPISLASNVKKQLISAYITVLWRSQDGVLIPGTSGTTTPAAVVRSLARMSLLHS